MNACSIQNFEVIQKNGIHIAKLHRNNIQTEFQSKILIFSRAMVKKTGEGDNVTFVKCNFWIFSVTYVKTNHIFGILRQNLVR